VLRSRKGKKGVRKKRGETHLSIREKVGIDVLAHTHLLQARVGKRNPDRLYILLDLQLQRQNDRRSEKIRVREQQVFDRAQVSGRRTLPQPPLRRPFPSSGPVLRLPYLDAKLFCRQGVAEEGLGDSVRQGDSGKTVRVLLVDGAEGLDDGLSVEVVSRDVESVGSVGGVKVGTVEEANGAGGCL
jgi:hypothetical protein